MKLINGHISLGKPVCSFFIHVLSEHYRMLKEKNFVEQFKKNVKNTKCSERNIYIYYSIIGILKNKTTKELSIELGISPTRIRQILRKISRQCSYFLAVQHNKEVWEE